MPAKKIRKYAPPWTAAEDDKIRRLRLVEGRTASQIAMSLKRTKSAVQTRMRNLGVRVRTTRHTGWTRADELTLVRLRVEGKLTVAQIAARMGRTKSSVANRIRGMQLARVVSRWGTREEPVRRLHATGLNDTEIARELGMQASGVHRVRTRLGLPCNITVAERARRAGSAPRTMKPKVVVPVDFGFVPPSPSLSGCWGRPGPAPRTQEQSCPH